MKLISVFIVFFLLASCDYQDGEYGATVGDCDEICTVYHIAQRKLQEKYKIFDRDFPDKEIRRKHVKKIPEGHRIESWFGLADKENDTSHISFACNVIFDLESEFGYRVKEMVISSDSSSQVIEYAEGEFFNCDTLSTNLELAICSLHQLEHMTRELDSIYEVVLRKMDNFALEDDILKEQLTGEVDSQFIKDMTDYRKMKQDIIKSQKLFMQYLEFEMQIMGESIGTGRERPIHENTRGIELIEQRIKSLKFLIE